jgi:hypothetical protein
MTRPKATPSQRPDIDPLRLQHLRLAEAEILTPEGRTAVSIDEAESPLAWLARRRGRDGRPLIEPHQFLAGEALRADFTRARLMPRTTSNWESPIATGRRTGNSAGHFSDSVIAARQRVNNALDAVGPEVSGLLVDVCCFLKRLEDIERERKWPARSAKIVLQLGLTQLARHYGLGAQATGRQNAAVRTWLAPGEEFTA